MPDWDAQVIRVRIPCRGNINFEWRRSGLVVSLGELMQALGKDFTAKQVYYFYCTLRIAALKRYKGSKAPSSASVAVGMSASGIQASKLRREVNKHQIMREYAAVTGKAFQRTDEFFNQAVRAVYAFVLRDLRRPWLQRSPPPRLCQEMGCCQSTRGRVF